MKEVDLPRIHRRALTMIELLVVIAVIAVIAALLLPALSRAKEQSRLTVCLNNLRQIGAAFSMYTDDHDGLFPPDHVLDPNDGQPRWTYFGVGGTEPILELFHAVPRKAHRPLDKYVRTPEVFHCPEDSGLCEFT
jgi:prepilin-type N-terminal cleavage/methylation domain-containing protein